MYFIFNKSKFSQVENYNTSIIWSDSLNLEGYLEDSNCIHVNIYWLHLWKIEFFRLKVNTGVCVVYVNLWNSKSFSHS